MKCKDFGDIRDLSIIVTNVSVLYFKASTQLDSASAGHVDIKYEDYTYTPTSIQQNSWCALSQAWCDLRLYVGEKTFNNIYLIELTHIDGRSLEMQKIGCIFATSPCLFITAYMTSRPVHATSPEHGGRRAETQQADFKFYKWRSEGQKNMFSMAFEHVSWLRC